MTVLIRDTLPPGGGVAVGDQKVLDEDQKVWGRRSGDQEIRRSGDQEIRRLIMMRRVKKDPPDLLIS
jgi:hypothetical protein